MPLRAQLTTLLLVLFNSAIDFTQLVQRRPLQIGQLTEQFDLLVDVMPVTPAITDRHGHFHHAGVMLHLLLAILQLAGAQLEVTVLADRFGPPARLRLQLRNLVSQLFASGNQLVYLRRTIARGEDAAPRCIQLVHYLHQ